MPRHDRQLGTTDSCNARQLHKPTVGFLRGSATYHRFLACAAPKKVYPREFQTRSRKNDDEIPDFQRMAKSIEPQLLADIARMEKSEKLAGLIDLAKIHHPLAAREVDDHKSDWEQENQLAPLRLPDRALHRMVPAG